ncbi:MAG TPA: M1 family metallopeptidase [Streptosporangiaceae bacterium]|nr:M1 family metallopeptidase [Streptosporangiaceae bacterium]
MSSGRTFTRWGGATGAAVTATLVATGLLGAMGTTGAAAEGFTPGAPGTGDPYFPDMGNGGYDVGHYDLVLAYDPTTKRLTGTARIFARATQNLSRFDLDFQGPLTISKLTVDGRPASFARGGTQELVVTPARGLRKGAGFTTTVSYAGVPEKIDDPALGLSGWVATNDGAVALNQPIGAATWYPVNDTPRDKATYTYAITVPGSLTALANGDPMGRRRHGDQTTYRWAMRQPMSSELSMVAIGRYTVTSGRTPSGIPNITAIDPQVVTTASQPADFHSQTAGVVDWEQTLFGRYPFTSTGGIADQAGVGYALETQGRPVYDRRTPGVNPSGGLLAHELAHQWYGDSVTPAFWKDIWLNEGFATYAEWLYSERSGGKTAQQLFDETYEQGPSAAVWKPVMADPGRDNIFHETVYDRGAMTLHMVRKAIGDAAFFTLLRRWPAEHRYGNVTTADFIAFAERLSGKDLGPLFQAWAFTAGKPSG